MIISHASTCFYIYGEKGGEKGQKSEGERGVRRPSRLHPRNLERSLNLTENVQHTPRACEAQVPRMKTDGNAKKLLVYQAKREAEIGLWFD